MLLLLMLLMLLLLLLLLLFPEHEFAPWWGVAGALCVSG